MVLSPDSEFFRFFRNAEGAAPPGTRRRPRRRPAPAPPRTRRRSSAWATSSPPSGSCSSSRAWSMAAFHTLPRSSARRCSGARERAAHRRAGGDRGGRRHCLAGAGVTQVLSSAAGQGRKHAVFLADTMTIARTIRLGRDSLFPDAPGGTHMTFQSVRPAARKALSAATAALLIAGLSMPHALAQMQPAEPPAPAAAGARRRRLSRRCSRKGRLRSPISPRACSTRWSTSRPRRTSRAPKAPDAVPMPQLPEGSPFQDFFDDFFKDRQGRRRRRPQKVQSLGSGFVVDAEQGIIVTNNHVIADADEIEVNFTDGAQAQGRAGRHRHQDRHRRAQGRSEGAAS